MSGYTRAVTWIVLPLLPVAVLLAISLTLFPSGGRDDAYITFWAAHALSRFGEIVNLNGDRIEQSSSLLHVLLLAATARASPLSVPDAGHILSILFSVVTIVYCQRLASLFGGWKMALVASLTVATFPPLAYWTTGAMETSLAALVNTALMYHYVKYLEGPEVRRAPFGVWMATLLFVLVRPESMFLIGAAILVSYVFWLITSASPAGEEPDYRVAVRVKTVQLGIAVVVAAIAVFLFRLWYFEALFPQPVTAKLSGLTLERLADGIQYLMGALFPPPFSILALFAMAGGYDALRRVKNNATPSAGGFLLVTFLLAHLGFIVVSGGDWMEGARFAVPLVGTLAVLAVLALRLIRRREFLVYAFVGILAFQVMGAVWFAKFGSVSMPVWAVDSAGTELPIDRYSWFDRANRTQLRDIPVTEKLDSTVSVLREATSGPVTIMSGQAGFVAYYVTLEHFGDIYFIDRRGLVTDHFTSCKGTKGVARSTTGMLFTYTAYFANRDAIEAECGVPRPDVIFELDLPELLVESVVERNGYRVIFRQTGRITTGSRLQGMEVLANEFIAVREDLVYLFDEDLPETREVLSESLLKSTNPRVSEVNLIPPLFESAVYYHVRPSTGSEPTLSTSTALNTGLPKWRTGKFMAWSHQTGITTPDSRVTSYQPFLRFTKFAVMDGSVELPLQVEHLPTNHNHQQATESRSGWVTIPRN